MSRSDEEQNVLDPNTPAATQRLDPRLEEIIDESSLPKDGFLFCAACSHVIGHVLDRIEVNGAFCHTRTNPFGYVHRFGCHQEAHGCAVTGAPQAADSWFEGFLWRLASCGACDTHMGWRFEKSDEHFFGLILERIQID